MTNPARPCGASSNSSAPTAGRLALVGRLILLSSLVSLASPFLMREIMDVALPQGRTGLLSLLALGMIVVADRHQRVQRLADAGLRKVGQLVMHDLRTAVYGHLQRMSLAFFTRTRTGEVQSRIAHDIGGMQATVTTTATSLVSDLTIVVATTTAMPLARLAADDRLAGDAPGRSSG